MERTKIKSYAPKARREFIAAVTGRAAYFGLTKEESLPIVEQGDVAIIAGRPFPRTVAPKRRALEERIRRDGFDQVMESMAYTWFNRFVALRYMELHGYLDHGYRVLSHPEGKETPEILEQAEHVCLAGLDMAKVIELKLDGSREPELYRLLLVAQCNALHEAMPFLFERIDDETELLLPASLLHSDSVIRKLSAEIEEAEWSEVEIIGWIYQFYIAEKKAEVVGRVVDSTDIPAATQFFTPKWIVKYLVQNSLGRKWLATYPRSPLRQKMEYYLETADQSQRVTAELGTVTPDYLDPEQLTLLDPCCGSGHILVEAYDLLRAMYRERGYLGRDIPRLILENNLFGLEIDERAVQLASFALLMRAREDDPDILSGKIRPNILVVRQADSGRNGSSSCGGEQNLQQVPTRGTLIESLLPQRFNLHADTLALVRLFERAETLGSLIRIPSEVQERLPFLEARLNEMTRGGDMLERVEAEKLLLFIRQAQMLARQYDVVVTNPPYMGSRGMPPLLKDSRGECGRAIAADLYELFVARALDLAKPRGLIGMVTIRNWLFLPSFEDLRLTVLDMTTVVSLMQIGYNSFPELNSKIALAVAFCFQNTRLPGYVGTYINLNHAAQNADKSRVYFENPEVYRVDQEQFRRIPGSRFGFWVSEKIKRAFDKGRTIETKSPVRQGFQTGDNDRFLRYWHELDRGKLIVDAQTKEDVFRQGKKWVPYNKGGAFRKWYGNNEYVVSFDEGSYEALLRSGNCLPSRHLYFREAITWSAMTSSSFGARYSPPGFTFSAKGACAFPEPGWLEYVLALLNSKVSLEMLEILAATLDFNVGSIREIPLPDLEETKRRELVDCTRTLIDLARSDWDGQETSWDFGRLPLIEQGDSLRLEEDFSRYLLRCASHADTARKLEVDSNRILIEAFDLGDEISPDVKSRDLTLYRPTARSEATRLLSYAIGCMMGRYSLDKSGLIFAGSRDVGFNPDAYTVFAADSDGLIPVTELAWFTDDAMERFFEFLGRVWLPEHLEESLKFLADSLYPGRKEDPRDTIRRYLATGFFKDHLQSYKKRPIYWLFSSGNLKAFQCLVYLHRYHEGTLARMRTEYVIPLQGKMNQRIEQLGGDIESASSSTHRRRLEKERENLVKQRVELAAFDEKLRHYADLRISLDLDDGVKVNYAKFGDLLAEVKTVTGKGDDSE